MNQNYASSANKLKIHLNLNREINTSQLMNANMMDSIFKKPEDQKKSGFGGGEPPMFVIKSPD